MNRAENFPLFDAHLHFSQAYLDQGLASLSQCGIRGGINLGGIHLGYATHSLDFAELLHLLRVRTNGRMVSFYWPDWTHFGWDPDRFVTTLCRDMERYAALGCRGLKVWKDLGMMIIHPDGTPARMDDPRLEPVWRTAAALHWTIAVHQADPAGSFERLCRTRLSREELWARRDRVISAHPELTFILCHSGNDVGNVAAWARLMERHPNTLGELNRDPLAADTPADTRAFLTRFRDRMLFGTDNMLPIERPPDHDWTEKNTYQPWRRILRELDLDEETFRKLTWENGMRLLAKPASPASICSDDRARQIVDANIAATHAYQVQLHRKSGRGNPVAWGARETTDPELARLVAHQQSLLATSPASIRQWVQGESSSFDPAADLLPLLGASLQPADASLPVNVIGDDLARQACVTPLQARALASLFQMMLDTTRDADRVQELFALYVNLGLPVHTAQIGLPARTDAEFMTVARQWVPLLGPAPFDTDEDSVRMQLRKLWNWGHRYTGERNRCTVARELLQEPEVQALLPRVRQMPPRKIAVIGHSFTMELHWQAPAAFVPLVSEMLAAVNPGVQIRQWMQGGMSLSQPVAEGFYREALAWQPDRVLFVTAYYSDADYAALERMTAGLRAAGVPEIAVFDHLRATRHNNVYEESDPAMQGVAERTGLKIIAARCVLDAAPDVDRFLTLDGIHMDEPYHRLMAKRWLCFLATGSMTLPPHPQGGTCV